MKKLYIIIILIILFLFLRELEIYCKINFHKIFYPNYYKYDKFNLDNLPNHVKQDIVIGEDIARKSKIVICGLARDISKSINNIKKNPKI